MIKYGVDKNGFIKTEVGLKNIKPVFNKIIANSKREILSEFGDKVHSLYVYGSVATGKARPKVSDVDLLLVFKEKPTIKITQQISDLKNLLSHKNRGMVRKVDIVSTFHKEVAGDPYGWGCFLKHLSTCISGEDISKNLPKFKPTKKVAKAFNGDIGKYLDNVLKKLKPASDNNEISNICSETMRKIVRTGFSLVMDQEQAWTTDLKKSCEVFSKYYPKQSSMMKAARTMDRNPVKDKKLLREFIEKFGNWISNEANKKL